MSIYLTYDENGNITSVLTGQKPVQGELKPGDKFIEGVGDQGRHYINLTNPEKPAIVGKQPFQLVESMGPIKADGVDAFIITNVPVGTLVALDGVEHVVNDRVVEVSVTQPGKYVIKLAHIKHLQKEISFEAI